MKVSFISLLLVSAVSFLGRSALAKGPIDVYLNHNPKESIVVGYNKAPSSSENTYLLGKYDDKTLIEALIVGQGVQREDGRTFRYADFFAHNFTRINHPELLFNKGVHEIDLKEADEKNPEELAKFDKLYNLYPYRSFKISKTPEGKVRISMSKKLPHHIQFLEDLFPNDTVIEQTAEGDTFEEAIGLLIDPSYLHKKSIQRIRDSKYKPEVVLQEVARFGNPNVIADSMAAAGSYHQCGSKAFMDLYQSELNRNHARYCVQATEHLEKNALFMDAISTETQHSGSESGIAK